jgi:uncharacterized protein (DUF58 family)
MRARLSRHPGPESRFIDPDVLARIDDLELVARTVVEGFISGLHRSPFLGLSMDFAEHRPYMPGDDIRRIDWRLYARTDRFYVKEFEAETNVNAFFALDTSRSMDFGSGGITKLDYGRFLAASLAYLSSTQRDRVGFASFDADIVENVPPSARRRETVLHAIGRARAGGKGKGGRTDGTGELTGPLARIGESLRRRGIVAVISDLYAEPDTVLGAVSGLRSRGHDLVVFHILDPAELRFPFEEASSFEDLETGEQLPVTPEAMVERYLALVDEHTQTLARRMLENGIDYALFDTSVPLDHALFHYLSHRERRRRSR